MPFRCKGVCDTHPDLFTTKKYRSKVGRDSFYCSICEKFVHIKNIIKNTLFKIKNACLCCKARFRKKSISDRQNKKYCKCGCGERIKIRNKDGEIFFKLGHGNSKRKELLKRKCEKCNQSSKTSSKEYRFKKWCKIDGKWNCKRCYEKILYHHNKAKKKLFSIILFYYAKYYLINKY